MAAGLVQEVTVPVQASSRSHLGMALSCSREEGSSHNSGPWSVPHSDIIHPLVAHLKVSDRWRWEGRTLRLVNRAWCKFLNHAFTHIAPHPSRQAVLTDVVSASGKFKSLQTLDLHGCSGPCTSESICEIVELPLLSTISLSGLCITDAGLRCLPKSTSLSSLHLNKVLVTNGGLAAVSRIPGLTFLELKQLHMISNAGLDHLSGLLHLRIIRCPGVTDDGLHKLGNFSRLERLGVISTNVTNKGIKGLKKLTQLLGLELSCKNITSEGLAHISYLKSLKDLCLREIEDIRIPKDVLLMPTLDKLSLSMNKSRCSDPVSLEIASPLSSLQLYGMENVNLDELLTMSALQPVKELGMGQIRHLSSTHLESFCKLSQLKKLNLQGCRDITNSDMAELRALSNLSELFLHNCDRITVKGVEHIASMPMIQKLTLGPNMNDDCVRLVSSLPHLTHLGFVLCNNVTARGLRWLKAVDSLRDLCFDWCKVFATNRAHEFKALAKMFLSDLDHIGLHPLRLGEDVLLQVQEIVTLKVDDNVQWVWALWHCVSQPRCSDVSSLGMEYLQQACF